MLTLDGEQVTIRNVAADGTVTVRYTNEALAEMNVPPYSDMRHPLARLGGTCGEKVAAVTRVCQSALKRGL